MRGSWGGEQFRRTKHRNWLITSLERWKAKRPYSGCHSTISTTTCSPTGRIKTYLTGDSLGATDCGAGELFNVDHLEKQVGNLSKAAEDKARLSSNLKTELHMCVRIVIGMI